MKMLRLLVIMTLFHVYAGTAVSATVPAPLAASMIALEKTVHFNAPDGTSVAIDPGDYVVAAGDRSLRLNFPDSPSIIVVAASPGTHEEAIKSPTPLSFAEEDQADIHHIVLLLPGGKSLDAVGTYSGIMPRGLGDRLAQRPLIQKAIQAKEAVQARIHDRLFGAAPPFSLGPNAFNLVFNEKAVGAAPTNAYLLTYLATLIYPDYLDQLSGDPLKQDKDYVTRLQKTPQDFVQEYAKYTHHLFWNTALPSGPANVPPQYVWVWGSRGGQDPEAMVISTPKTVFLVFRGTDRVAQAKKKVGYNWAEWIQTDFDALGVKPDVGSLQGLVHKGFWESLTAPATLFVPSGNALPPGVQNNLPFREAVFAVIKAFGGGPKKVWVTGHSLGAAHTQLYGAYLTVNGLSPQGVYAIAAPHVGDHTFVGQLNGMFPNQRLQRFDFAHDPVTQVPPNAPLPQKPGTPPITYVRAGTRVYYDDVTTVQFGAPERPPAEANRMAALLTAPIPLTRLFAAGDFCFHYPQWYLNAAYAQLDRAIVGRVPSPLPTPVMRGDVYSWLCGPIQIARGNRSPGTVLGNIAPGK
jgi:Lipase (class 3)